MATATYSIQYTDKDGKKQTLKGVTDVKAMTGHIKSIDGTDIVVLKGAHPASSSPSVEDPDPTVADDSADPVTDPTADPAQTAASTDAPDDSMQTSSEPGKKPTSKKGSVPAGLAKYLASKK